MLLVDMVLCQDALSVASVVVSFLINCGADLNAEEDCRETPLQVALQEGHGDIVRLLLGHGADANYPLI
jgi:ankyrin repeat protein